MSIFQPFYMVVRIGSNGGTKRDAMPTRHHATYEEALEEAKRLAMLYPTHERGFAVVRTECIVKADINLTMVPMMHDGTYLIGGVK